MSASAHDDSMSADLAVVLALLVVAIVMFAIGRPRTDAVALLMLTALPFTGVLSMKEALAGFADGNVVLIATLFVIGKGLVRTGVARRMGDRLVARARKSDRRLVMLLMLFVGALGSVMSSTGVVAIFIPVVMGVARTIGVSPSRLMMPLSVAALSSGMLTLVATAPNLVVNSELVRQGGPGFRFFSFTPIGLPILLVSIAYMLAARRWLPAGSAGDGRRAARPGLQDWIAKYGLEDRELRLRVSEASPLLGRTVESVGLRETYGADVLAIERPQHRRFDIVRPQHRGFEIVRPTKKTTIQDRDVLLVDRFGTEGDVNELVGHFALTKLPLTGSFFLDRSQDLGMAEVLVGPDSPLVGQTASRGAVCGDSDSRAIRVEHCDGCADGARGAGRREKSRRVSLSVRDGRGGCRIRSVHDTGLVAREHPGRRAR